MFFIFKLVVYFIFFFGFSLQGVQASVPAPKSPEKIQAKLLKSTPSARDLLAKMNQVTGKLTSYSVTQIQRERFGNKMGPQTKVRIKFSTGKIYIKVVEGDKKGAEILYAPGWNEGEAKVHKGSFPDITVNLDVHGWRLMEDQHHPIYHVGFPFILDLISTSLRRCGNLDNADVIFSDTANRNPDKEWIELVSPSPETKVTPEKDETLWSFAKRMSVDPFLILHTNGFKNIDDFSDKKEFAVPLCYATRTVLGIDRKKNLLSQLEAYDKQGELYESYEWLDLDPTPLTDLDFDPKNPAYKF